MTQLAQISFSWTLDYYLERISIKLAELFGAFSSFVLLIFLVMAFCSFLLWIILPFIELRKTNLLQKIYNHLVESEKLLVLLNRRLSDNDDDDDDDEKKLNNQFR